LRYGHKWWQSTIERTVKKMEKNCPITDEKKKVPEEKLDVFMGPVSTAALA
jgi:hypothetical protein